MRRMRRMMQGRQPGPEGETASNGGLVIDEGDIRMPGGLLVWWRAAGERSWSGWVCWSPVSEGCGRALGVRPCGHGC